MRSESVIYPIFVVLFSLIFAPFAYATAPQEAKRPNNLIHYPELSTRSRMELDILNSPRLLTSFSNFYSDVLSSATTTCLNRYESMDTYFLMGALPDDSVEYDAFNKLNVSCPISF